MSISFIVTLYCHLWQVWVYHVFPHYFTNGTIFGEGGWGGEVIKHKIRILIFSITFAWNVSHIIINVYWTSCKVTSVLSVVNRTWTIWTDFGKTFLYQISWKSAQWEPSFSILTDRRIDRRHKANCRFSRLPSAHTVYLCVLCGSQNKQRLFPYTAATDWFL